MAQFSRVGITMVSAALLAALTQLEGTRYVPYEDIVNVWTVCQGYAGKDVVKGRTYTPAECKALAESQLAEKGAEVLRCTKVDISQNEYDAYTLFAYNVGTSAFCNSSLLKKLNQGDHVGACNGLLAWRYAGGKEVRGLLLRREFERKVCLGEAKLGGVAIDGQNYRYRDAHV
jgi:lysozyme